MNVAIVDTEETTDIKMAQRFMLIDRKKFVKNCGSDATFFPVT